MSVTDVLMTRAASNGYSHPRPRDPGMSTRSREGRGRGCGNGKDSRNVGWLLSGGAGGKPSVRNIWDWERSLVPSQHWELSHWRGLLWQQNLKWILQSSQIVWARLETTPDWSHTEPYERINWSIWRELFRCPISNRTINIYRIFPGNSSFSSSNVFNLNQSQPLLHGSRLSVRIRIADQSPHSTWDREMSGSLKCAGKFRRKPFPDWTICI